MTKFTNEDAVAVIKEVGVKLDWEKFNPELKLTEQGADSLDMITIIFAIQEKYGIKITDDSISNGDWLSVAKITCNLNNLLQ